MSPRAILWPPGPSPSWQMLTQGGEDHHPNCGCTIRHAIISQIWFNRLTSRAALLCTCCQAPGSGSHGVWYKVERAWHMAKFFITAVDEFIVCHKYHYLCPTAAADSYHGDHCQAPPAPQGWVADKVVGCCGRRIREQRSSREGHQSRRAMSCTPALFDLDDPVGQIDPQPYSLSPFCTTTYRGPGGHVYSSSVS